MHVINIYQAILIK